MIIKNDEIESMEGLTKAHFLNENAIRTNKSLGDLAGLKNLGFHIIEVKPGHESTEYHSHEYEDECVYILSGSATATINDVEHEVNAGDFIGHPAGGEAHTMKNTGQDMLVCIVVGQRLPHDIANYPHLDKRLFRNTGSSELVNVGNISNVNIGKKS
ncbi:MAG: cupin domain-containing protein [Gammaproteobacteria bacterium]|nr:cupin domain-containing protein [Gammaproteobacteria bacterium]